MISEFRRPGLSRNETTRIPGRTYIKGTLIAGFRGAVLNSEAPALGLYSSHRHRALGE